MLRSSTKHLSSNVHSNISISFQNKTIFLEVGAWGKPIPIGAAGKGINQYSLGFNEANLSKLPLVDLPSVAIYSV